jgi:hypothetical protein
MYNKIYDFGEGFFFFLAGVIVGASCPLPPGVSWWEVGGIIQLPLLCGIIAHIEGMRLRSLKG